MPNTEHLEHARDLPLLFLVGTMLRDGSRAEVTATVRVKFAKSSPAQQHVMKRLQRRLRPFLLDEARIETLKVSDRIASEQQNLVAGAAQLMTALAQLPEVKARDAVRIEPILGELCKLNPMYSNIIIADRKGTVWASALPVKRPFGVADRRYFRNVLATGQLSSGEYVVSRTTIKPAFNLAYPLKDDQGAIIGVISVSFGIERYRKLVERMHLPPWGSITPSPLTKEL